MSTNQLLAKALSTTSEDEAIACLRMARKKGATIERGVTNGEAEEWAQLVTQAREESYKYKRMLDKQVDVTLHMQKDLDKAAFLIVTIPIGTLFISSLFWLILLVR